MDWVVTHQIQSKRLLEKQLNEIETKQKQNEVKRLKEIRDLGVDLARLKRSTRDLDDFIDDLSPSPRHRAQPRRGSLPCLDSSGGLSSYFEPSQQPRSSRRLSCIAALPVLPDIENGTMTLDKDKQPVATGRRGSNHSISDKRGSNPSVGERRGSNHNINDRRGSSQSIAERKGSAASTSGERRGSNPSIDPSSTGQRRGSKTGGTTNGSTASGKAAKPPTTVKRNPGSPNPGHTRLGRRGSQEHNDNGSPRRGEGDSQSHNVTAVSQSHNVTAVYFHQDEESTALNLHDIVDDEISEAESCSMFAAGKHRSRRASEPALGGHYIKGLQEALDDIPALVQQNSAEIAELKKSIKTNLPSDMVAENAEEEQAESPTENTNTTLAPPPTMESLKPSSASKQRERLSSISETDQDEEEEAKDNGDSEKNNKDCDAGAKGGDAEKPSFHALRQRRRSDGDVLKFSKSWKIQSAARASAKTTRNKERTDEFSPVDEKNEIWDAVRKCRYIRGHEPPDMNQPEDLREFVFGRRN